MYSLSQLCGVTQALHPSALHSRLLCRIDPCKHDDRLFVLLQHNKGLHDKGATVIPWQRMLQNYNSGPLVALVLFMLEEECI